MCGIGGVRRFGNDPIREEQITILLCANERRGNSASGVALQQEDGTVQIYKTDVPAWKFTATDGYTEFLEKYLRDDTVSALVHTRAWTKGAPSNNHNNHPLFLKQTAVVHNGIIRNDDHLFEKLKLKRNGEVDSDIIRALLDENGLTVAGIRALNQLNGSAAIAAVSSDFPGKLLLARTGSPLVIAATKAQMIWASEKAAIHSALRLTRERFGVPMQKNRTDVCWLTMPPDTAYLFGDSKLEWRDKFSACANYTAPRYNVHDNYSRRTQDLEKYDGVICRNKKCGKLLQIPKELLGLKLWEMSCKTCGEALADEPKGLITGDME